MKRLLCLSASSLALLIVWLGWLPSDRTTTAQKAIVYDHFAYLPLVTNDYDPAWNWSPSITPTLSPSPQNVVMVLDQAGYPHILWDTTTYGQQFIYHTRLTAQGWTTPTAILPTLGVSYMLYPPVIGSDGKLHLLWRNQLSENGQQIRRLLYTVFDGTSWGAEQEVYRIGGYYSVNGMVQLDGTGTAHATFLVSYLSSDIYHSQQSAGGWTTPVEITLPSLFFGYLTVWPDQLGGVRVYYDASDGLHFFNWRNNQFLVNNQLLPSGLSSHGSQLDGQNNLHTFWTGSVPIPGGSVTGLYYQCLTSNLIWGTQQVLSGQNNASSVFGTSDRESGVALIWNEASSRIRLGIWNSCTQTDLKTTPIPASWTLKAVVLSSEPKKVCALTSRSYYPVIYNVTCANFNR